MSGKALTPNDLPLVVRMEDAQAICLIDIDTNEILYMNAYIKNMLQLPAADESYCGQKCYAVLQGLSAPCAFCKNHLLTPESFLVEEIYQPSAQRYFQFKSILLTYGGRRLRLEALYDLKEDELQRQQQYLDEKLQQIRWVDSLTGLYNREKYNLTLKELETQGSQALGIIDLDINGLGHINAAQGYKSGDAALVLIAEIMRQIFGKTAFRVGSDEFIGLVVNSNKDDLQARVQRLKDAAAEAEVGVSIGNLWWDNCGEIYKKYAQVNAVMEAGKALGYRHDASDYNHRAERAHRLLEELAAGRFAVYLQPKINLATGKLAGAEALIRKFDEQGQIIAPAQFVPQYENTGLINYVDTFVLEQVCQWLREWQQQGYSPVSISCNISRVTLMSEDVVTSSIKTCEEYGIDGKLLDIEITESFGTLEKELLMSLINKLHDAGFSISMDDFGTSFSNLELLSQIHFDTVKFDKSLVDDLVLNPKAQILFKAGVSMCREFGDTLTLAEGIETKEQLELLRKFGCQLGQGYYFDKPLPVQQFLAKYLQQ